MPVGSTTAVSTASSATRTPCAGNTASDRASWCDFSIDTDYYEEVPDTGVTREYWFTVQESTLSPDGYARYAQTINGTFPGPLITADWGDTVSLQAWEGVAGPIIINGPSTANYDEDKGMIFLSDWSHTTVDEQYYYAQSVGPPTMDTALINGMNVYGEDSYSSQTGSRFETSVEEGTSYRFRLVNGAIDTHFKFSIDNHTLTVMAMDFVPIVPYETDILNIAMGQRYDVVVTANKASIASDFWIRAIPQSSCSENDSPNNVRGILHYGSSTSLPTTTGHYYADDECIDESPHNLVPYISKDVSQDLISTDHAVTVSKNPQNLFRWFLNNSTFETDWTDPTILQVSNGVNSFAAADNLITLPNANEWVYLIIHANLPVPHPIHLHGHDFFVLAQSTETYDAATVQYNLSNPPRRDVALLPSSGYLVMAFITDNPGAWLAHCHIGWHTSEGFALQFLERADEISGLMDADVLQGTCDAWGKAGIEQDDSGV
ncbi:multicopper oxidase protein [Rutstroemia sp. NJR-2017a BVV2]|nr:multicopper oxidase protein [Rutstroemia sp. NJR-2017a BVV2]